MQELDALYEEFMGRFPPDKYSAAICRSSQGRWLRAFQKPELAEERFAAAYALLPRNLKEFYEYAGSGLSADYAQVLAGLGKFARAEEVIRENLRLPPGADQGTRAVYLRLVEVLCHALCLQDRFAEATRMLEEPRRLLAASGGTEADLLEVDVQRGEVLARSGNAGEALKVFANAAASRLSDVGAWRKAVILAAATGNRETHRELCRIGVVRFASTAQGSAALSFVSGLLLGADDEMTLPLARGLVERLDGAPDWSQEYAPLYESMLALREHRHAEALVLLDKFLGEATWTGVALYRFSSATCACLHPRIPSGFGGVASRTRLVKKSCVPWLWRNRSRKTWR